LQAILENAYRWLVESGIQETSGGVARYYRSDSGQNAPVSTEITGYFASALVYLHPRLNSDGSFGAVLRTAQYLARDAWDPANCTIRFEPGSPLAFFFDLGIVARGLLAAWRATGQEEFRARAREAALSLAFDFMGDDSRQRGAFHPVITLPEKEPLPYEPRWSRRPGCYQLKSALAWLELGDPEALKLYESVLAYSLATHESFLADEPDREARMDRLHAYCYFLEGLLPVAGRDDARRALASGIEQTSVMLREIAPAFERSDVCAQLLRVRLIAHHLGAVTLNKTAACEEADRVAGYQLKSADPRLDGGFGFGQKHGKMLPFVNPVSTAFCLQALALWQDDRAGAWRFELNQLI
jgi:hypothetical protein